MPKEINWKKCDERLFDESVAAIRRFGKEHSQDNICYFAFDSEPRYGYVIVGFDTLENNTRSSKELEMYAVKSRAKNLKGKAAWKHTEYYLNSPVLSPFNTNSGDFVYPQYHEIKFPEWTEYAERQEGSPNDDSEEDSIDDDFLESSVRLVLWRVAEQLIKAKAFKPLRLASPFMVGYGIHDQEETILRILNWPPELSSST